MGDPARAVRKNAEACGVNRDVWADHNQWLVWPGCQFGL